MTAVLENIALDIVMLVTLNWWRSVDVGARRLCKKIVDVGD